MRVNMKDKPPNRKRRPAPNYFASYRPHGDTLHAKVARAHVAAAERPITLARVRFLKLPFNEEGRS
jgi:hypothetical protein